MNYLTEIKAFYDLILSKPLSTGQIALWHALMNINNKCAWMEWFSAPNRTLEMMTGLSRQTISQNRNVLKQYGFLDFRSNGKKATLYRLNSLQENLQGSLQDSLQGSLQNNLQDRLQENLQDSGTLNKLNKTKQNLEINHARVRSFYENRIGMLNHHIATCLSGFLDEMEPEVVERAISIAAGKGVSNWKYINTILSDWLDKGIRAESDLKKLEHRAGKHPSDMPEWMEKLVKEAEVEER